MKKSLIFSWGYASHGDRKIEGFSGDSVSRWGYTSHGTWELDVIGGVC